MQDSAIDFINADSPNKLGSLLIGEQGTKDFGDFTLVWKVNRDHLEWALNDRREPQESWLAGILKPAGWNRIEIQSEQDEYQKLMSLENSPFVRAAHFEVYFHQWPSLKTAMDFIFNDLLDRIHPRWEKP